MARELLGFLANPLVIILLIASLVSAVLGEKVNAAIIVVMVVLSVVLNFVQTYRSQRAAERLREEVAPTATVLRDGRLGGDSRAGSWCPATSSASLAGDRVPADARLIETRDLHVQEAALTGESLPVEKEAADLPPGARQAAEARNTVFLGTSVVSGTATAVVVATGPATAFGDIAARLSTQPPETEFERGLAALRAPDHAHGAVPRALRPAGELRPAPPAARIVPVRRGAGRGPDARVPADDHHGHPARRARCAWRGRR